MKLVLNVKQLADARGLNRADFARASGLSYDTAVRLFHDGRTRIDLYTLAAACEALDADVSDVLVWKEGDET
jgi:DNA-binding Xre family transcriptional regulator